jgi:hypothetical protein
MAPRATASSDAPSTSRCATSGWKVWIVSIGHSAPFFRCSIALQRGDTGSPKTDPSARSASPGPRSELFLPWYRPWTWTICVSSSVNDEGELNLLLTLKSRRVLYPLGPFPQIREFQSLLTTMAPGDTWDGSYFFAHTDTSGVGEPPPLTFAFREFGKGVQIEFSAQEWNTLRNALDQVMSLPELQPTLHELTLAYGDA